MVAQTIDLRLRTTPNFEPLDNISSFEKDIAEIDLLDLPWDFAISDVTAHTPRASFQIVL